MKLSKIVSVLFVGSVLFSPMAVQSKPMGVGYGDIARLNQLFWQKCTAFAEEGRIGDHQIVADCAVIGVYVEGNTSYRVKSLVLELVESAQRLQAKCINLYLNEGTSDVDTIRTCANLGVGVDNTNLD